MEETNQQKPDKWINDRLILASAALVITFSILVLLLCGVIPEFFAPHYPPGGRDAAIRSNIEGSRVAAELWWDDHFNLTEGIGSYEGVCNSPAFQSISKAIETSTKKPMRCFSSKTAYCTEADLTTSGEWCADSTGYSGSTTNCTAESFSCGSAYGSANNPVTGPANFEFESGPCDASVDPYDQTSMGVKDVSWINDKTLQVTANVSLNCAENIGNGGYEVSGNKIILKYKSPTCETCAKCMCSHKLTYRLINLEKKDYTFELKRTY